MSERYKLDVLPLKPAQTDNEAVSEQQVHTKPRDLRPGDRCPVCGRANMDYDGLLNLICPACGYVLGGCFT
ncbi:MAG: hypothetical protein ACK2UW_22665 [Anaerolineales bacterium]